MPSLGLEHLRKTREFKFQKALYAAIIQVLDSAVESDKKIKPRRALMVVATSLAGFFIAVLAAFMAEYWAKVFCDPEERERLAKMGEYLAPITKNGVACQGTWNV